MARISSVSDLLAAGGNMHFVLFYGHRSNPGTIGKTCLSQFYPAPFSVEGRTFPTAEHYMMTNKALQFDPDLVDSILANPAPEAAKRAGRTVRNFDPAAWAARAFDIVVAGNLAKFKQNPELRDFLLSTGDAVLVEASPDDRIWGIGLAASDPEACNPEKWPGTNLLGFALMKVRQMIRDEAGEAEL